MAQSSVGVGRDLSAVRLWAEMLTLFVGMPLVMAFLLPPNAMQATLIGVMLVGIALLFVTPGWRWRRLITGPLLSQWRLLLVFTIGSAIVVTALVFLRYPGAFLWIPLERPGLWLAIMTFYPTVLVIPQEILFRPLFFERYGHLFPNVSIAIGVNSAFFGLAHLFYWNWPAVVLTTVASVFFAYAYVTLRSFPLAWLLHVIGGLLVFTLGLGWDFFHGAVGTTPPFAQ